MDHRAMVSWRANMWLNSQGCHYLTTWDEGQPHRCDLRWVSGMACKWRQKQIQEITIRISAETEKGRRKAMKIAASVTGVQSVMLTGGHRNLLLVIGEGVDTNKLRKKLIRMNVGAAVIEETVRGRGNFLEQGPHDEDVSKASQTPAICETRNANFGGFLMRTSTPSIHPQLHQYNFLVTLPTFVHVNSTIRISALMAGVTHGKIAATIGGGVSVAKTQRSWTVVVEP
uniref:HMA domain-containing protein n=1 Tax=Oryza brachyantha TaxID=4533 RepID=J3MWJ9_ORYBR